MTAAPLWIVIYVPYGGIITTRDIQTDRYAAMWRDFNCSARRKPRTSGYTFVELSVVLLIMSILASISTMALSNSKNRFRADVAARGIVSAIDTVRTSARTTSATCRIQFSVTGNSYTLVGVANPNQSGQSYVVNLNGNVYQATLQSASLGADTELIFSGFGVPDSGGTIQVAVDTQTRTITVDATTGKATIL